MELVGDAYVRIHADSAGMEDAIRREVTRAADTGGRTYLQEFDRYVELHADRELRGIFDNLTRAVATGDWDAAFRRAGTSIDRFATEARRTIIQINDELIRINGPGGGMTNFNQNLDRLDQWARSQGLVQAFRNAKGEIQKIETSVGKVADDAVDADTALRRVVYTMRDIGDEVDENDRLFRRFGRSLDRTVILMNRDNDLLGRMFGARSRSEFLNFFGRTIDFFATLPALAVRGLSRVMFAIDDVIDRWRTLREANVSFGRSLQILAGQILRSIVPALGAIVTGGLVVGQLVPMAMLLILDLIGAIAALASAILVGLVGALTVLAGMVPALVAGIGFIIVGMSRWADASDKVKKQLKPLTQAWAELQQRVGDEFLGQVAKNADGLAKVIRDFLKPTLFDIGDVFGRLLKQFTDLFNSKQMKPFLDALRTSIPRVLESLGSALIKFGAGLTAALKPLLPIVEKVAKKIEEAATEWLSWATSPRGQKELQQWFQDLYDTAVDLWNLLGSIGQVLGTVIRAATGVGSGGGGVGVGWLKTMTDNLKDFDKWLNEPVEGFKEWDPETKRWVTTNKTRIQKFFEDVATTVNNVSTAISELAAALAKVDWDETRENLETFITALGKVGAAIGTVIGWFNTLFTKMDEFGTRFNTAVRDNIITPMETFGQTVNDFFRDRFRPFGDAEFWQRQVDDLHANFVQPFQDAWNALFGEGGWWGKQTEALYTNLVKPFQDAYNAIFGEGGWWSKQVADLEKNITELPGKIAEWIKDVAEALTKPFRDWWNNLFGASIFPQVNADIALWLGKIPGIVATALAALPTWLTLPFTLAWMALAGMLSLWPGLIFGFISQIPGQVTKALAGLGLSLTFPFNAAWVLLAGSIGLWPGAVFNVISKIPGEVGRALSGLASTFGAPFKSAYETVTYWIGLIKGAINALNVGFLATGALTIARRAIGLASGGIVYGPTYSLIGEAGREAIVPLDRPLSLVDPSVRQLSAYAQGKMAAGGVAGGPQIIFEPGSIVVQSASIRPELVAEAVVDRIAARVVV